MNKRIVLYEGLELLQMLMNKIAERGSVPVPDQLQESIKELVTLGNQFTGIQRTNDMRREMCTKIADCILLLLGCASRIGCTSDDLRDACIKQLPPSCRTQDMWWFLIPRKMTTNKNVTVEITPEGWTTTVQIGNKIMVEKNNKTSYGAARTEGNFEYEKDIPRGLYHALESLFSFDVMNALNF